MKKKKIEVTDEEIREAGENCNSFAQEYWLSMTPAQQAHLVALRERKVSDAAYRMFENEEATGIQDKMEELRSLKSPNDESIRDIYFKIPDEVARIKAINDLFNYERLRSSHETAMVYEAHYRYAFVHGKLISGWVAWPELKRLIFGVAVLDAVVLLGRLIWPDIKESADWIIAMSVVVVYAYGIYWDIHLRRFESHYFLLWEIEKLRRGIHDPDLRPPVRRFELFGERERQSGNRSVPREDRW